MKQLTCEMCGGTDLIKQDGVFVCQNCGTKYSVEEAKKMMIEGTVNVQGTVKVDASEKLKNLYVMARRAKDDNNAELASKYYEMIALENPLDWEAAFYFNYYKAKYTNLQDMRNSVIRLSNSLISIFDLIDKSNLNADEKWRVATEIVTHIDDLCDSFVYLAKSHYRKFSNLSGASSDLQERTFAIADLEKNMAVLLQKYFADKSSQLVADYLKLYVKNYLLLDVLDRGYVNITLKFHSNDLIAAEKKIKELDPNYVPLIDANAPIIDANAPIKTNRLTGENFYGPLLGYILWACFAGIILFAVGSSMIKVLPWGFVFFLLLFLCPCVLLLRLIVKKVKSGTHDHRTSEINSGKGNNDVGKDTSMQ